jgi:hypothetical protein
MRYHRAISPHTMTLRNIILALAILTPMAVSQLPAQQTLNSLRDRNRVLLIFAPDTLDGRFGQQMDLLDQHAADFQARDLVVLLVVPDSSLVHTPPALRRFQVPLVHDDEKITIRHRFRLEPSQFAILLLGKDGGEKLRSATPISVARLNRTIDAMPMRKDEMRSRP